METCIHCNHPNISGNYCSNCGERTHVPDITLSSLVGNAVSTITTMDKGYLYNVKHLLLAPDKIVKAYLQGKRKQILNPVSFLIITTTVYLIIEALLLVKGTGKTDTSEIYSAGIKVGQFIKANFKYFWLLSIVWLSIPTKMIYGKYNFVEHLAINSFIIGQATVFAILGYVFFKVVIIFNPMVYGVIIWLLYRIFSKHITNKTNAVLKTLGAAALFFVIFWVALAILGFLFYQIKH